MHGAIVVFDLSDESSYSELADWVRNVGRYAKDTCKLMLGNKLDLGTRAVQEDEARSYADSSKCKYFEVSAKDGTNMEEALMSLVSAMVQKRVGVEAPAPEKEQKGCCILM